MIYRGTSHSFEHFIDKFRTGNFGEDATPSHTICTRCSGEIRRGDSYYVLDDALYCMNCTERAEAHILSNVRDNYIYVF